MQSLFVLIKSCVRASEWANVCKCAQSKFTVLLTAFSLLSSSFSLFLFIKNGKKKIHTHAHTQAKTLQIIKFRKYFASAFSKCVKNTLHRYVNASVRVRAREQVQVSKHNSMHTLPLSDCLLSPPRSRSPVSNYKNNRRFTFQLRLFKFTICC